MLACLHRNKRRPDCYVETERNELTQQSSRRDELDRHFEARVLTLMDRLREAAEANVAVKFELRQIKGSKKNKGAKRPYIWHDCH